MTDRLAPIEQIPYRPARAGTPAEGIFLRKWQEFAKRAADAAYAAADEDSDEFLAIFRHANRRWTQPMASAAASLVTWFGTNCGHGFLRECEQRLRESSSMGRNPEACYLASWALENQRLTYLNHGLRCIEFLLTEHYPIVDGGLGRRVEWSRVPEVTMEHQDAIECVVRWLPSSQGRAFIAACDSEIEAQRKNERLFHQTEHNVFGATP